MGNASSAESEPASAEKMETSDANGSPKRQVSCAFRSRRSVEADQLCRSLRDKGLCISENDMEKVLAKHNNIMEALTYAITSGMTRKLAKVHRGQVPRTNSGGGGGGKKRPQENVRPPLAPSSSATSSKKVNQKRSRSAESETSSAQQQATTMMAGSRGERPSKRPAVMRSSLSGSGSVRAEAMKRSPPPGNGSGQRGDADSTDRADSAGGGMRMKDDDDTGGVLTVLQQGSPPRQRLARSRDALALKRADKSSSGAATADKLDTGFAQIPDNLTIGMIDTDMVQALERWAERASEQKEAAVREVIKGLCLNGLGAARKERLDEELAPCIHAAMEDLAQSNNIQNGAMAICKRARAARLKGHASAVAVSGQYRFLYGDGDDGGGGSGSGRSRSNSSDVQMNDGPKETSNNYDRSLSPIGSRLGDLSALYSPASPAYLQPPLSTYSPTTPAYGPPSPSGSARAGGRSSQHPGQQPRRHFTSRSPSDDSRSSAPRHTAGPLFGSLFSHKASPPRRPPLPPPPQQQQRQRQQQQQQQQQQRWTEAAVPAGTRREKPAEEKALESANDIFRVALRHATRSRKEEEWLERQLGMVEKSAEELHMGEDEVAADHQEKVNSAREELEEAKDSVEEATKKAFGPHMESSATKEEALRSLISSLPQQSQSVPGSDPLEPRRRAIIVQEAAEAKLKKESIGLMLALHGTNISKVLFDAMYGDLMDRISRMQQQAHERRVICQESLKSTGNELSKKYQAAITYHIDRTKHSENRLKELKDKMATETRFFGEGSYEYRTTLACHLEMQDAVTDSSEMMKIFHDRLQEACSSMEIELPEEDMHNVIEDTKRYLTANRKSLQKGEDAETPPMG